MGEQRLLNQLASDVAPAASVQAVAHGCAALVTKGTNSGRRHRHWFHALGSLVLITGGTQLALASYRALQLAAQAGRMAGLLKGTMVVEGAAIRRSVSGHVGKAVIRNMLTHRDGIYVTCLG